ncbi:hypothetical protein NLI96_g1394 [Meripilus lineatus]|uniref:Uncharacterized protein n=1 Tax=Meripilus lineatus TaxID=2056292 RepID=A0AAD5VD16_9APHY|nr:hypothetical protein NLI96_g1394 [Physisporinus lineatus]
MNSLPSPSSHTTSTESSYFHNSHYSYQPDPSMKTLVASTWQILEQVLSPPPISLAPFFLPLQYSQPPPPSLREILGAYRAKGDGDRDMLLAMLNAKSAEDQRLASVASLHRTMLEMYRSPVSALAPHSQDAHQYSQQQQFPSPPTTSYHHSPPLQSHTHSVSYPQANRSPRTRSRVDSSDSAETHLPTHHRDAPSMSNQARKRRRTSRSPAREQRSRRPVAHSSSQEPMPPSPYSPAPSQSSEGSPRSRESMAIGSLLSADGGPHEQATTQRRTSSERSTSSHKPTARH